MPIQYIFYIKVIEMFKMDLFDTFYFPNKSSAFYACIAL